MRLYRHIHGRCCRHTKGPGAQGVWSKNFAVAESMTPSFSIRLLFPMSWS